MRLSETIARELAGAALAQADAEALAVSDMLRESARPENFYTAENLSGSDGVFFDGHGSLTSANSRLDPKYMAKAARRAKKRAVEALNRCKPQDGERLRLLTLTMPQVNADFGQTKQLLRYALVLLKKRQWFKRNVRGAVIGVEFTLGATGDRWHVHAHLLAWSRWIEWKELGTQWTGCLRSASRRLGLGFDIVTEHKRAVVDVRHVTAKGLGLHSTTMESAIQKVCGYLVKGSGFASVPQAQKCDVRRMLDGCRLIETYGECNRQKGKRSKGAASYLVIQDTTDGTSPKSETSGVNTIINRRPKRMRGPALKTIGAEMIRQGRRPEWLELLSAKFKKRRQWRMIQLARANPLATFTTLDGLIWQGEAHW
ncbi:MAG TPA: hypothetical protein VF546_13025 [Pyrinomonadaceae bacterium]|jgi:hypothetical protein